MKAPLDLVHVAARCHLLVVTNDPAFLTGGIARTYPIDRLRRANENGGVGRPELIAYGCLPPKPPDQIAFTHRVEQIQRVCRCERDAIQLVAFRSERIAHGVTKYDHAGNLDVNVRREGRKLLTGVNREV